jgi:hypothetical protein
MTAENLIKSDRLLAMMESGGSRCIVQDDFNENREAVKSGMTAVTGESS